MIHILINTFIICSLSLTIGLLTLLLRKREKNQGEGYLIAFLLASLAIGVVEIVASESWVMYAISDILQMSIAPILYLYIRQFNHQHLQKVPAIVHLTFPLFSLGVLLIGLTLGWDSEVYWSSKLYFAHMFVNLFGLIIYSVLMLSTHLSTQLKRLPIPPAIHQFHRTLIVLFIVFSAISYVYVFINSIGNENAYLWLLDAAVSTSTLAIILAGALKAKVVTLKNTLTSTTSAPTEDDDRWEVLFQRIEHLMQQQQLFLQPALKVDEIATQLNSNRNYVSKAINTVHGDSVSHYINHYRLRYFKEKVLTPAGKQYSLDALAMESGFNSKASFNRFFKLQEGITPSQYRDQQLRTIV